MVCSVKCSWRGGGWTRPHAPHSLLSDRQIYPTLRPSPSYNYFCYPFDPLHPTSDAPPVLLLPSPQVVGEFGGHAPDAGADLGVWAARLTHLLSSSQWGSDSASAAVAGAAGTGAAGAAGAGASEAGAGAGAAASGGTAGAVSSAQVERQRSLRQDEFDPEVSNQIPWFKLWAFKACL